MNTASKVLESYFSSSQSIGPISCSTEEDLDSEVKNLLNAGIAGTPVGILEPEKKASGSTSYIRDAAVKAYILIEAKGRCERCNSKGPFISELNGLPYLEHHHVKHLSQGGSDTISNSVAVCPNCHRELHYLSLIHI